MYKHVHTNPIQLWIEERNAKKRDQKLNMQFR